MLCTDKLTLDNVLTPEQKRQAYNGEKVTGLNEEQIEEIAKTRVIPLTICFGIKYQAIDDMWESFSEYSEALFHEKELLRNGEVAFFYKIECS